jgi:hypothetical protein
MKEDHMDILHHITPLNIALGLLTYGIIEHLLCAVVPVSDPEV